jgi:hypothetical protein
MGWLFDEGVYQTEYLVYPEFIIKLLIAGLSFSDIVNNVAQASGQSKEESAKIVQNFINTNKKNHNKKLRYNWIKI